MSPSVLTMLFLGYNSNCPFPLQGWNATLGSCRQEAAFQKLLLHTETLQDKMTDRLVCLVLPQPYIEPVGIRNEGFIQPVK